MRRLLVEAVVFVVLMGGACALAAPAALFTGGMLSGVSTGLAPQDSFKLVERLVCPAGTSIEVELVPSTFVDSDGITRHGTQTLAACVGPDGSRQEGVEMQAVAWLLGIPFAACFLGILIPVALVLAVVIHLIGGAITRRSRAQPSATMTS